MPRTIIFDQMTDVSITISKDPSGQGNHKIEVQYAWLAQDGEKRAQPALNIFPWLQRNAPETLALITQFYDGVVQAVMDRDGLS